MTSACSPADEIYPNYRSPTVGSSRSASGEAFVPAPSNFGATSLMGLPLRIPSNHPAIVKLHAWHEYGASLGPTNNLPCRRGHAPSGERRYDPKNALILSEIRLQLLVALRVDDEAVFEAVDAVRKSGLIAGNEGRKRKRGCHQCSRNCQIHECMPARRC